MAKFRADNPDVTLMDDVTLMNIRMPKVDSIDTITAICAEFPKVTVLHGSHVVHVSRPRAVAHVIETATRSAVDR